MYCPACNVTVPKEDIVKGYQYSKGEYVVIDEQVIDGMKPVSDSVMEITEFVPLSEIDPIIYENANFLSPDKGGKHAFEVIRQSMLKNNVVGIASYISRGSEHTMIIRPYQNGLVAQRIWLDTEVRSFDKWTPEVISDKELEVGGTLIQHMLEQKFDYATLKNKYLENKRQYVNSVIAGEAAPVVETEAVPEPTVDIMAAFTASVNAPRKTRAKKAA
jgi:DNA end-binding protein Ku